MNVLRVIGAVGLSVTCFLLVFSVFTLWLTGFVGYLDSIYSYVALFNVLGVVISAAFLAKSRKVVKKEKGQQIHTISLPSVSEKPKSGVEDASAIPVLSGRVMNDLMDVSFQESRAWLKLPEGYRIVKCSEASSTLKATEKDLGDLFQPC